MKTFTTILASLTLALVASHASAGRWEAHKDGADGAFAITQSTKFTNSFISVHFLISSECTPMLSQIVSTGEYIKAEEYVDIQFRVDDKPVVTRTGFLASVDEDRHRTDKREIKAVQLTWEELNDVADGYRIQFRTLLDDGSKTETDRASLIGSRKAITKAKAICEEMFNGDWGTDDPDWDV